MDCFACINPLSTNPAKWSNTLKQFFGKLQTNCLSVFDHIVKLALKGLNNNVTYFDSFGVEHIPNEVRKYIGNKNRINIFKIQAYDSVMCRYICIGFVDSMLSGKNLTDFTKLFSPNDF